MDAITREPRLAPARTTTQFRDTEFTQAARVRGLEAGALAAGLGVDDATRGGLFGATRVGVRAGARASVRLVERAGGGFTTRVVVGGADTARDSTAAATGSGCTVGGATGCATGSAAGGWAESIATTVVGVEPVDCESMAATGIPVACIVLSDATTPVDAVSDDESTGTTASVPVEITESVDAEESGLRTAASRALESSSLGSPRTSHAPTAIAANAAIPTPFQM